MNTFRSTLYVAVMLSGLSAATGADDLEIDWHTIDGGGETGSVVGDFELSGSIGQPDADWMTGGGFELSGGFWPGVAEPSCSGDLLGDGDTDIDDYEVLADCLVGPGQAVASGCEPTDLDTDGDVDLVDFAAFQVAFGCS